MGIGIMSPHDSFNGVCKGGASFSSFGLRTSCELPNDYLTMAFVLAVQCDGQLTQLNL